MSGWRLVLQQEADVVELDGVRVAGEWRPLASSADPRGDIERWAKAEGPRVAAIIAPGQPAPGEFVPWPTADGYWWCHDPVVGSWCVVEARVEAESSWIYFSGVEYPLYVNEPRKAWEFTPAMPPRMGR